MFNRNTDRSAVEEPRRAGTATMPGTATLPSSATREAVAVPVGGGQQPRPQPTRSEESLVAAEDNFEGKLRTSHGVRILGNVSGQIESTQYVHIEENARVDADISAEEVVIAGEYSGKLTCRQRLEIRATGRVAGQIETVKLMLHEGGYFDGELHMQKPSTGAGPAAAAARARTDAENPRPAAGSGAAGGSAAGGGAAGSAAASAPSLTTPAQRPAGGPPSSRG